MSHRRRFLNLVMSNELTGVYSLHRVNLLSRHNNLFYPTPAAAREAAAAKDPSALFSDDVDGRPGKEVLKKLPRMRLPPAPAQNFRQCHLPWSSGRRRLHCAALSESETVFLGMDFTSRGAFVLDSGGRRSVVALPDLHASIYDSICFSVTSDDAVYVMERSPRPDRNRNKEEERRIQFQALVHRRRERNLFHNGWRCEEFPPPPYIAGDGYLMRTAIGSHALVGGGAAGDVICISTAGIGTYCFDTASREWSKAGDWTLPFTGKIEHDRDLGIWVGFLDSNRNHDEAYRICASTDLFSATERDRLMELRDTAWWRMCRQDCKDLLPPDGWYMDGPCRLVGLGSGKFCLVQFFETRKEACSQCEHEDADDKFALFTGVEVMRCGGGGKDGDEQAAGDGRDKDEGEGGELRIVVHKSKRYMLTDSEGSTIGIDYVL